MRDLPPLQGWPEGQVHVYCTAFSLATSGQVAPSTRACLSGYLRNPRVHTTGLSDLQYLCFISNVRPFSYIVYRLPLPTAHRSTVQPASPAFLARSSRICNFLSVKKTALVIPSSDMPASSAALV